MSPNPEHCWFDEGDATCQEQTDGAKPFCVAALSPCLDEGNNGNAGCVAELPDEECYSPCGGQRLVDEEDSCIEVGDGDGDVPGEGDTVGDGDGDAMGDGDGDGDPGCTDDLDCTEPGAPFCDPNSGMCVSCGGTTDGDAACASLDPAFPLCVDDQCVQCDGVDDSACTGMTPVCEVESNACIGCFDHNQCPDSACDLDAGNCIDPNAVIHVDGDEPCDTGDGSEASPYCSIGEALAAAEAEAVIILHERGLNPTTYFESNTISTTVAIFAAGDESPVVQGAGGPIFSLNASGTLFARGIIMLESQGAADLAISGNAWLEQCRVINNSGDGILVDGGHLELESSFVGGSLANLVAIDIIDGSVNARHSTVVTGTDDFGTPAALRCIDGSNVTARNSIFVGSSAEPEIQCPNATIEDSVVEDNSSFPDSIAVEFVPNEWFVDYLGGDFHLSGNHPPAIDTAATWQPGDPLTDIDGDPRPQEAGAPDVAGADIP